MPPNKSDTHTLHAGKSSLSGEDDRVFIIVLERCTVSVSNIVDLRTFPTGIFNALVRFYKKDLGIYLKVFRRCLVSRNDNDDWAARSECDRIGSVCIRCMGI